VLLRWLVVPREASDMLSFIASFIRENEVWISCGVVLLIVIGVVCQLRIRRLRAKVQLAQLVEDELVQDAQGVIMSVHGIVTELDPNDQTRKRTEQTLDRADEQLSELRERIEGLRKPE
jgi:hypothetical protein